MQNPLRIGSFNLYKFSRNASKERLQKIAEIIKESEVDIVAVQEVFSEEALKNLLMYMEGWKMSWDSPQSRSVSAAEGYGFLWNENTVLLSRNRSGKVFEPVIHNQYPHKDVGSLIRNPYYGRFVLKNNEMCEIRLINTHIMFSLDRSVNESDDHDASIDLSDLKMRKREFEILASKILPKLEDKTYDLFWGENDGKCRNPYTILLGDYNLNLKSSGAKGAVLEDNLAVIMVQDAKSLKEIITVQDQLTTLRKKNPETEKIEGYRNNFDHFTYDKKRPIKTKCWALDAPRKMFGGNYDEYKKLASDHLMIVLELSFE